MAICGINAQLLTAEDSYRKAGIHVYISETIRHLPTHPNLQYKQLSTVPPPDQTVSDISWLPTHAATVHPIGRILWEQLVWPIRNRRADCDIIHGTAFSLPFLNRKPSIVTIFDLSFIYYPELFPALRRFYLTTMTRIACSLATKIITISESSKADLIRLFHVDEEKVSVIYPGLSDRFNRVSDEEIEAFRAKKGLPKKFILHVGTLQPRKNLPLLIDAFHQANLSDTELVFAGGKGWFYEEIFSTVKELGLESKIHFPGYVSDEELPLWYAAADLLVFPSKYEGFGMPIVEAMGCGTPVIASNASAMPEAIGDAGLLFDPQNSAELAKSISSLLENDVQMAKMREAGFLQAKKFSWEVAGEQTAAVYVDLIKGLRKKV